MWRGSKLLNIIFKILSTLKNKQIKNQLSTYAYVHDVPRRNLWRLGDNIWTSFLSFYLMGPVTQALAIRVIGRWFYPCPTLLASSCKFWDPLVRWPLLLYVASSLFPQPNARPLWAPLHVSIGGNPVWKASSFCLWEVWGRKGSYFASLNVLGFNNVSDISVSSMRRNNRVSRPQSPCFMRFLHLWFPVDRGIMSKGLWLVSELEASLKS